jgi:hypothetical protein
MGQQQLILLVLATVIVGLAIVVGIQAFTENSARANADAMMQDAVRIANDIQATIKKPAPFGGLDDFEDITGFGDIGYPDPYSNLNGEFTLACVAAGCVITGDNAVEDNQITVAVCGLTQEDITGAVVNVGGQPAGTAAGC